MPALPLAGVCMCRGVGGRAGGGREGRRCTPRGRRRRTAAGGGPPTQVRGEERGGGLPAAAMPTAPPRAAGPGARRVGEPPRPCVHCGGRRGRLSRREVRAYLGPLRYHPPPPSPPFPCGGDEYDTGALPPSFNMVSGEQTTHSCSTPAGGVPLRQHRLGKLVALVETDLLRTVLYQMHAKHFYPSPERCRSPKCARAGVHLAWNTTRCKCELEKTDLRGDGKKSLHWCIPRLVASPGLLSCTEKPALSFAEGAILQSYGRGPHARNWWGTR